MSSRSISTSLASRLIAILALFLAHSASGANAQNVIEKIVSPGALSSAHQEFADDCASCHASFDKSAQSSLCLSCHKAVAADIKTSKGFHGKSPAVDDVPCKSCHTEHEGAAFNIAAFDEARFDHALTDYPLSGGHSGVKCGNCHAAGRKFRDAPTACVECHKTDDPHKGTLGPDCQSCHNIQSWKQIKFDHAKTRFPLLGKHQDVRCTACHLDQKFKGLPARCVDCHRDDDIHKGAYGADCASCHTPFDWAKVAFDHGSRTRFALKGKHAVLSCPACHTTSLTSPKLQTACVACHKSDDAHKGRNGPDCASCHGEGAWTSVRFDHDRRTKFALKGAHKALKCESCHLEPVTTALPGTACIDCHRNDDPHKGSQGPQCGSCHNETSWTANLRFDHDLGDFPLLGKHKSVACGSCHISKDFRAADPACSACHAEDDVHQGSLGEECADCHNPSGWPLWTFVHDTQTDFPLTGAHQGLKCAACHRPSGPAAPRQSSACISCHRADDRHRGQFGPNCDRCHGTTSFAEIRLP
ncbi:MAG: cytochrome c3 family protein [Parvularculaceae bacterium]